MNRPNFSKTLLLGGFGLVLTGRALRAAPQPLKLALVSRVIDVNGRAAPGFGLTGRHLYHVATGIMATDGYEGR